MGYKLLGWAVWKGGTWYLRRRYGTVKPAVAGGLALLALGGAVAAAAGGPSS
jgi:hypothetical protein